MLKSRDTARPASPRRPRPPSVFAVAKRIVGIDLAQTGPHVYVAVDSRYQPLWNPRKAHDELGSLEQMYQRCREGLEAVDVVAWVMEPTGTAWMRMLAFLKLKGEEAIYAPSSRKFSNLRKTLYIGVKSDKVDALALAKIPAIAGHMLKPLVMPSQELLALKRTMKVLARQTKWTTQIKLQLGALMGLLNPGALKVLTGGGNWTVGALNFVRDAYDPREVSSKQKLRRILNPKQKAGQEVTPETEVKLLALCQRNAELVNRWEGKGVLPVHLEALRQEVNTLLEELEGLEERKKSFEKERDKWLKVLDPDKELLSVVGIGPQLGAVILAYTGPIERFANIKDYKGFIGHVPGSGQSGGDKPAKGKKITKAGPNALKAAYYLAGETGKYRDPQLAEFACRLQDRGLEYAQIIVAVGNKIAMRVYSILKRRYERDRAFQAAEAKEGASKELVLYELRSPEGEPISKKQAKQLVEQNYRLRSKRNPNPVRGGQEGATEDAAEEASLPTRQEGVEGVSAEQVAEQSLGPRSASEKKDRVVAGKAGGKTVNLEQEAHIGSVAQCSRNSESSEHLDEKKGPPPELTRQPSAPQGGTDPNTINSIIERVRCRPELKKHLRQHQGELGEEFLAYLQRPDLGYRYPQGRNPKVEMCAWLYEP